MCCCVESLCVFVCWFVVLPIRRTSCAFSVYACSSVKHVFSICGYIVFEYGLCLCSGVYVFVWLCMCCMYVGECIVSVMCCVGVCMCVCLCDGLVVGMCLSVVYVFCVLCM